MKIDIPFDYIAGHLRYGHLEGEIELDPEAEKEFKELLKKELNDELLTEEETDKLEGYKEDIKENSHIVVDDFCIEDCGEYHWEDLLD